MVIEGLSCNYDVFPSMVAYLGLHLDLTDGPPRPGTSFASDLLGRERDKHVGAVFHEYEKTRAVQTEDWKLIRRHPSGPDEFYCLRDDPGERVNLIHAAAHQGVRGHLGAQLDAFFGHYATHEYDLWRGGRSKAGLITG